MTPRASLTQVRSALRGSIARILWLCYKSNLQCVRIYNLKNLDSAAACWRRSHDLECHARINNRLIIPLNFEVFFPQRSIASTLCDPSSESGVRCPLSTPPVPLDIGPTRISVFGPWPRSTFPLGSRTFAQSCSRRASLVPTPRWRVLMHRTSATPPALI